MLGVGDMIRASFDISQLAMILVVLGYIGVPLWAVLRFILILSLGERVVKELTKKRK